MIEGFELANSANESNDSTVKETRLLSATLPGVMFYSVFFPSQPSWRHLGVSAIHSRLPFILKKGYKDESMLILDEDSLYKISSGGNIPPSWQFASSSPFYHFDGTAWNEDKELDTAHTKALGTGLRLIMMSPIQSLIKMPTTCIDPTLFQIGTNSPRIVGVPTRIEHLLLRNERIGEYGDLAELLTMALFSKPTFEGDSLSNITMVREIPRRPGTNVRKLAIGLSEEFTQDLNLRRARVWPSDLNMKYRRGEKTIYSEIDKIVV